MIEEKVDEVMEEVVFTESKEKEKEVEEVSQINEETPALEIEDPRPKSYQHVSQE